MNASDNAAAAALLDAAQARTPPGQDRGPSVLALQLIMMITSTIAVVMRFIARRIGPGELWWDDWVIFAALLSSLGGNVGNIVAIHLGLGRHMWDAPNFGVEYLKTIMPVQIFFTLGVGLAKGSVLLLYRRIFSLDRIFNRIIYVVGTLVVLQCVSVELSVVLQCRPIRAYWDPFLKGDCIDFRKLNMASAIGHVVTTMIVICLPQPLIWKLHMHWGKKMAYSGICFLGILTAVASIGRLIKVNAFPDPRIYPADFTWYATHAILWYTVEPAIGIICGCLPCIGPIFRKNPFSSSKRSCIMRTLSPDSENSLQNMRSSDADDASMIRRLGATCETSIYTTAASTSEHVLMKQIERAPSARTQTRRRDGSEGRIHVRNSTYIN